MLVLKLISIQVQATLVVLGPEWRSVFSLESVHILIQWLPPVHRLLLALYHKLYLLSIAIKQSQV